MGQRCGGVCFYLDELSFAQWEVPEGSVNGAVYGRTSSGFCWRELASGATADRAPPLVQTPWSAQWDSFEQAFYFENPEGEETFALPPIVPAGWRARWSDTHDVFWFMHESTGRTFWELDVPVLQSQQLLEVRDLLCRDVRRSFKRAALRLHPDKGGDEIA